MRFYYLFFRPLVRILINNFPFSIVLSPLQTPHEPEEEKTQPKQFPLTLFKVFIGNVFYIIHI